MKYEFNLLSGFQNFNKLKGTHKRGYETENPKTWLNPLMAVLLCPTSDGPLPAWPSHGYGTLAVSCNSKESANYNMMSSLPFSRR